MKKVMYLFAAAAMTLASCDNVDTLTRKGQEAFDQKDYAKSVEYFNKAIEKDAAHAAVANRMLGIINADNLNGDGTAKQAVEYYTVATEQGDSIAKYLLGEAYDKGNGTVQNSANAVKYYTMSADAGYPQAQATAGWIYLRGYMGAAKDEEKAVKYLADASQNGNADASAYLGWAYQNGLG
ncbi:MAG: sel1 repeat family protein, partial [Muribaculaceae bacterium]|nr:sel1 repeat family protein [Muribaculaceae bacterium]